MTRQTIPRSSQIVFWGLLFCAASAFARAEDLVRVGGFTREALSYVADAKGFLKTEGIRMEYVHVRSSAEMMRSLLSGSFDLIHTNADNVIAWAEGQGADPHPSDLIIFMGGRKGLALQLVAAPGIKGFDDLKGKQLAVDALTTGYTPVLVEILKRHGLELNRDYTIKALGGGPSRSEALIKGEAAAGFVAYDNELKKSGFTVLANSQDYLPEYAVSIGATRREWANQHQDLLVRYIRAMLRATNWLLDPKNKADAIATIARFKEAEDTAGALYEEALDPHVGLIPDGKVSMKGVETILHLRELMGQISPPLPPPDKYVDERFYGLAILSLKPGSLR